MFKKYHVGEFIKNYMIALGIKESDLVAVSGSSQKHINNIITGKVNLTIDVASKISKILTVSPVLLMGLQNQYLNYLNQKSSFQSISNQLKKMKCKTTLLDSFIPNYSTFASFQKNPQRYADAIGIVHYQPAKSNQLKNWLMIEALNDISVYNNELNREGLSHYIKNNFKENLNKVNNQELALEFFKKTQKETKKFGVNINYVNTGLQTTIKGISKINGKGANVMIEFSEHFDKVVWYLIHELTHIMVGEAATEQEVNITSQKIICGDFYSHSNVNEAIANQIFEMLLVDETKTNAYIFHGYWRFANKKHYDKTHSLKISKGEWNDLLYIFVQ